MLTLTTCTPKLEDSRPRGKATAAWALVVGLALVISTLPAGASEAKVVILEISASGADAEARWSLLPGQQLPLGSRLVVRDEEGAEVTSAALPQSPWEAPLAKSVLLPDALGQVATFGRQYWGVIEDFLGQQLSAAYPYRLLATVEPASSQCGYDVIGGVEASGVVLLSPALDTLLNGLGYCDLITTLQALPPSHLLACEIEDLIRVLGEQPMPLAQKPAGRRSELVPPVEPSLPAQCGEPCSFFWQAVVVGTSVDDGYILSQGDSNLYPGFFEAEVERDSAHQCVELQAVGLPDTLQPYSLSVAYEDSLQVDLQPRRGSGSLSCACQAMGDFQADYASEVEATADSPSGPGAASAAAYQQASVTVKNFVLFDLALHVAARASLADSHQDDLTSLAKSASLLQVQLPAVADYFVSGSGEVTAWGDAWSYAGFNGDLAMLKVSAQASCVEPTMATLSYSLLRPVGNKLSRWPPKG